MAPRPNCLLAKDPKRAAELIRLVQSGLPMVRACRAVGWSLGTVNGWIDEGRKPEGKKHFVDFVKQIDAAYDIGVASKVKIIEAHALSDWRAAAWLLARQDPETYGKEQTIKVSGVKDGEPITIREESAMDFSGWSDGDIAIFLEVVERNTAAIPAST